MAPNPVTVCLVVALLAVLTGGVAGAAASSSRRRPPGQREGPLGATLSTKSDYEDRVYPYRKVPLPKTPAKPVPNPSQKASSSKATRVVNRRAATPLPTLTRITDPDSLYGKGVTIHPADSDIVYSKDVTIHQAAEPVAIPSRTVDSDKSSSKGVITTQVAEPVSTPPKSSTTTSCKEVCNKQCEGVNHEVCADVKKPFQDCKDVPVESPQQQCERVCSHEPDLNAPPPTPEPANYKSILLSLGKGKGVSTGKGLSGGKGSSVEEGVSTGKGRRMLGGKGFDISDQPSTGWSTLQKITSYIFNCRIQCRDVPATKLETVCETQYRTDKECKTVTEESCQPVCKQVCEQVPVVEAPGKGH